ncbi:MFS transporter [Sinosporangium siamense]|uniref:MFS transporter n=1 Tax=Sinosporangium siamense TaxID=1367973 RepID=A0A919RLE9_9ACTN|nr:MFS transporter [Sinosporangium siamense]GII94104.1 hypothetical protein Ssi02_43350 [Sinosporangium siamense]
MSGHFAAYTYVQPFLEQVSHAGPALVGTALLMYGAAGVAGNFAAGAWAVRNPRPVLVTLAVLMALSHGGAAPDRPASDRARGVGPGLRRRGGDPAALDHAVGRWRMGTALFVGTFNVSIALGSFAGGRVVDGVSISAVMWVGAALAVVSAAVAGISGRSAAGPERP